MRGRGIPAAREKERVHRFPTGSPAILPYPARRRGGEEVARPGGRSSSYGATQNWGGGCAAWRPQLQLWGDTKLGLRPPGRAIRATHYGGSGVGSLESEDYPLVVGKGIARFKTVFQRFEIAVGQPSAKLQEA